MSELGSGPTLTSTGFTTTGVDHFCALNQWVALSF